MAAEIGTALSIGISLIAFTLAFFGTDDEHRELNMLAAILFMLWAIFFQVKF